MQLFLITVLMLVFLSGELYAAKITVDELLEFNPDMLPTSYFQVGEDELYSGIEVYKVIDIMYETDTEEIVMVQGSYTRDEWYPWFDQEEGEKAHLGFFEGDMYSQQIYLRKPVGELERKHIKKCSGDIELGEAVPLNFYELKKINPGLAHYEELDPPIAEDGSIVLLAPPGSGLAFVADNNRDIYAIMQIIALEEGEVVVHETGSPGGGTLNHPELGKILNFTVYFREPTEKFDLSGWLEDTGEVVKKDVQPFDGFIEPGFISEDIDVQVFPGGGFVSGTVLNETGKDYSFVSFSIKIYDEDGVELGGGKLFVMDLADGQKREIMGDFSLSHDVDIDEIVFEIDFLEGEEPWD